MSNTILYQKCLDNSVRNTKFGYGYGRSGTSEEKKKIRSMVPFVWEDPRQRKRGAGLVKR